MVEAQCDHFLYRNTLGEGFKCVSVGKHEGQRLERTFQTQEEVRLFAHGLGVPGLMAIVSTLFGIWAMI